MELKSNKVENNNAIPTLLDSQEYLVAWELAQNISDDVEREKYLDLINNHKKEFILSN